MPKTHIGQAGDVLDTITGVLTGQENKSHQNSLKKLKVKVLRGKDLAVKDHNGLSDPYVRVIVGGKEHKTKIAYKTLTPEWNEELEFEYDEDDELEELHIICMDWDKVGGHDFMGEYYTYVKNLLFNQIVWFPLLVTTTEEAYGEIAFEFTKIAEEKKTVAEKKKAGTLKLPPENSNRKKKSPKSPLQSPRSPPQSPRSQQQSSVVSRDSNNRRNDKGSNAKGSNKKKKTVKKNFCIRNS
jgi:hypothetical protein